MTADLPREPCLPSEGKCLTPPPAHTGPPVQSAPPPASYDRCQWPRIPHLCCSGLLALQPAWLLFGQAGWLSAGAQRVRLKLTPRCNLCACKLHDDHLQAEEWIVEDLVSPLAARQLRRIQAASIKNSSKTNADILFQPINANNTAGCQEEDAFVEFCLGHPSCNYVDVTPHC